MKRVLLSTIIIILAFVLFGCSKQDINISYLKMPSSIDLIDNKNDEINSIKKEFKNLDKGNAKYQELSNKLLGDLSTATNKFTLKINDNEFITKIINKIKGGSGFAVIDGTKYISNNAIYHLHLSYSDIKVTGDNTETLLKEGYVSDIWIFEDGMAMLPKYDLNASNKITAVGVSLDNETLNYLKEYYSLNILK